MREQCDKNIKRCILQPTWDSYRHLMNCRFFAAIYLVGRLVQRVNHLFTVEEDKVSELQYM